MSKKAKTTKANVYLLLDRSGSMSSKWEETLSAVNVYAKELDDGFITVAMFDENGGLKFDVIRDKVEKKSWANITDKEAYPRGSTPLYDALLKLTAMAEKAAEEKTVVIVVTDGFENASREATKDTAKAALDRCRAKNWQVVFLGADFDAFNQATSVGTNHAQTVNMVAGNYGATASLLAMKTAAFTRCNETMSFSVDDRDIAMGVSKNKKDKK